MRLSSLDLGIGAVAAHAVRAEDADAEHEILERLMCAHSHPDSKCLSRFEDVGRDAVGSHKLDGDDLGLA